MKLLFYGILSGFLILLSLPPFNLGFLAWIAFVPILFFIQSSIKSGENVFWQTFIAAVIVIGGISYSLLPFSFLFYAFLMFFLPVLFGLMGEFYRAILKRFPNNLGVRILVVPTVWTLTEFALTESPLSLPLNLALSQASYLWVIQIASVGGIYLVSFTILLVNALLCEVAHYLMEGERKSAWLWSLGAISPLILVLMYGIHQIGNSSPLKTLNIVSIQPVISSEDYRDNWIDHRIRTSLSQRFHDLTERALALADNRPLDFLIWPEGGNGYYNMRLPLKREEIQTWAKNYQVNILLSSLDLDEEGKKFNSVFSIDSDGHILDRYDKVHLTPIGERGFTPGNSLNPLTTKQGPVGILICFESSFSSLARTLKQQGAQFLLISSSDAPFRNSVFPLLHAGMAVFRAVENRIAVVRAANTGPSLTIDPWGRIVNEIPFYETSMMTSKLSVIAEKTFYTRFGNGWLIAPAAFFFGYFLV